MDGRLPGSWPGVHAATRDAWPTHEETPRDNLGMATFIEQHAHEIRGTL